jgi:hypothetical protein
MHLHVVMIDICSDIFPINRDINSCSLMREGEREREREEREERERELFLKAYKCRTATKLGHQVAN